MSSDYFHGYALNGVDRKGRLSIPSDYRIVIGRRSATSAVLIALHERADCLIGCDVEQGGRVMAELQQRFGGVASEERDRASRLNFGSALPANYDETGRIVLPDDLRELAGIDDCAFFLAAGDYFEIWNPDTLLASADLDPRLARLVRKKLADRKAAS